MGPDPFSCCFFETRGNALGPFTWRLLTLSTLQCRVDSEGREWYVSMVAEFIEALQADEGIVRIRAIPGLLPE